MRTFCCFLLAGAVYARQLDLSALDLRNVTAETTAYRGSKALKLVEKPGAQGEFVAILKNARFSDGSIELDVAGAPAKGAGEGARGFIGLAFRVQPEAAGYECIYLRPTNGRAGDQLRRNHSTQYISFPDWPWERLREETPGVYESYVDLQPGEWTKMRIVVEGRDASLFVGGAGQPCLLIHDLKLSAKEGGIALWIGPGTEGYFRNLNLLPLPAARAR
jgi:hypothetical protein